MVHRIARRLCASMKQGVANGQCVAATPGGRPFKIRKLRVRNLVGSRRMGRIALHPMTAELRQRQRNAAADDTMTVIRCVLDQTTFPALRCAFKFGGDAGFTCTALIFGSGRLIVTGVKKLEHLEQALTELHSICTRFPSPNTM